MYQTAFQKYLAHMDSKNRTAWVAIGAGVLVLGGMGVMSAMGDDDASGQVKLACHDWVKDRLKSPASADFSGEKVEQDGSRYVVTGAVDSQNSFGAPIRNTYRCEATNADGASHLVRLTGLEN